MVPSRRTGRAGSGRRRPPRRGSPRPAPAASPPLRSPRADDRRQSPVRRDPRRCAATTRPRDTDRHDLEPVRVEVTQDAARRHTGDRMLGTAAAVDDADADPGTVSHKVGEATAPGVQSRHHVGDQVVGVLDTCRDAGEPVRDGIPTGPAGPPRWMPPKLVAATSRSLARTTACTAAASESSTETREPNRRI